MRVLLLAAAGAAVRGQLDAGLRSRIRFPPQLPGRHVVWEGHPRVGLGNVLAGWGDLYYKAIARDKSILVSPIPRISSCGATPAAFLRRRRSRRRPGRGGSTSSARHDARGRTSTVWFEQPHAIAAKSITNLWIKLLYPVAGISGVRR